MRSCALRVFPLALLLPSCVSWFSGEVGTGVARLTVRTTGAVLTLVSDDTTCGFASPDVAASAVIAGEAGGYGTVTWSVEGCVIDVPEPREIDRDCDGAVTSVSGKLTVSARRTIAGRITGDAAAPVIPSGPEEVTIEVTSATFEEFEVKKSTSDSYMKVIRGTLSAVGKPRLAQAQSSNACAIATPNVHFSAVSLREADAHVVTPDREFDVDVATSSLEAQNGRGDADENTLTGSIEVFGHAESVPVAGDVEGLDPDYERDAFVASYSCKNDLTAPVSFACDLVPSLGQGVSRLAVRTLGTLVSLANDDALCGFASDRVLGNVLLRGTTGDDGGEAVASLGAGCLLSFPEETAVSTDCHGNTTYVRGTAFVTGQKSVRGYLTGDPATPAVPTSPEPATFTLSAELTGFTVRVSNDDNALTIDSGVLSGTLAPRMAIDTRSGACSLATPIAAMSGVQLAHAAVRLNADGKRFDLHVESSNLDAQNGRDGQRENELTGAISIEGRELTIPVDPNDDRLDPNYHALLFDAAYQCDPNMVVPESDGDCSFRKTLGEGAARLLIATFAMITKKADADLSCGFSSPGGLVPDELVGSANQPGHIRWDIENCVLGSNPPVQIYTDCLGERGFFGGQVTVAASKLVYGIMDLVATIVKPQNRESASFDFANNPVAGTNPGRAPNRIALNEFYAYRIAPNATAPEEYLVLHDGTLTGYAHPVTGQSIWYRDQAGETVYTVPTRVSSFEHVAVHTARATLHTGAMRFNILLDSSDLNAFLGSYNYRTNSIAGTIVVDGVEVTVPIDPNDPGLDPEYDQTEFDNSYACTPDLVEVVPLVESL